MKPYELPFIDNELDALLAFPLWFAPTGAQEFSPDIGCVASPTFHHSGPFTSSKLPKNQENIHSRYYVLGRHVNKQVAIYKSLSMFSSDRFSLGLHFSPFF